MVHVRLSWFLEKNKILSSTEFGCRKNRSTLDSLTCLEHQIRKGFEQRKLTVAILFDIQKAYDTTWRYPILRSLYNNGLRGNLPIFIKNFPSERTFQTRIDSTYSDNFKLKEGIPQGSVLSGTLFAIAINNIVKSLPYGVNNNLFVDDFAINYSSNNLRHIQRILSTAINKIHNWSTSVSFKLAIEKTQGIIFFRDKRWLKNQNIELKINNLPIKFFENVKFLGLIFDQRLNFKAHVNYVKGRALKSLKYFEKIGPNNLGI